MAVFSGNSECGCQRGEVGLRGGSPTGSKKVRIVRRLVFTLDLWKKIDDCGHVVDRIFYGKLRALVRKRHWLPCRRSCHEGNEKRKKLHFERQRAVLLQKSVVKDVVLHLYNDTAESQTFSDGAI